jgi:tetratricopeptide (TPR) repeat protein
MKKIVFTLLLVAAAWPVHAQDALQDVHTCNQSAGDPDLVIAACTRLLTFALDGDRVLILSRRAGAYTRTGDSEGAIGDLNEIIRLAPSAYGYEARGIYWQEKGEEKRAAADFEEAESRGLNTIALYLRLALAHIRLKQDDKAMRALNFGLLYEPGSVMAYYWRGLLRQEHGEHGAALEDFDAALKLSPDTPEIAAARAKSRAALDGAPAPAGAQEAK